MSVPLYNISSRDIPGFTPGRPDKKILLLGQVGLFADSPEQAYSLLPDFRDRVHGVIVTAGDNFYTHLLQTHLYHLTVPGSMMPFLPAMLNSYLALSAQTETLDSTNRNLQAQIDRYRKTVTQTRENYDLSLVNLTQKMSQLRKETQQHKEAKNALQQSQSFIRHLLASLPDLLWLKDENGAFVLCNQRFEKLLGTSEDEIIGKTDYDFVDPQTADLFRENDRKAIETKQPKIDEEPVIFACDGHREILETIKTPIFNEDGSVRGVLGIARDITARKKAETELVRYGQYIKSMVDAMPSILIGVDDLCQVNLWNSQAEKQSGVPSEKAVGRPVDQVWPPLENLLPEIKKAMSTRSIQTRNRMPRITNQKTRFEDITIYPLASSGKQEVVVRIDDVTKQCELELQLNQSRKMDAIGQLAGGIAHDFNNLLTGITGAAELLIDSSESGSEAQKSMAELILTSASRGSDLTGKLMTFSQKGIQETRPVDIRKMISETLSILLNTLDKKIQLSADHEDTDLFVLGNYSALQNAMINLGINASHAMKAGGSLTFTTRKVMLTQTECTRRSAALTPGPHIYMTVTDTGYGIDPQHIHHIFEPFFTTRKLGEGTGLGLAAVYGTIQDHRGHIQVQSQVGTGTTFELWLPHSAAPQLSIEPDPPRPIRGRGIILFVDDESAILRVGQRILSNIGYDVLTACDGVQAMDVFTQNPSPIDLVLMDIVMPRKNGYETFMEMKTIRPDCPIILASGYTRDASIESLYEKGLSAFIQKPYRADELSRLIMQHIHPAPP